MISITSSGYRLDHLVSRDDDDDDDDDDDYDDDDDIMIFIFANTVTSWFHRITRCHIAPVRLDAPSRGTNTRQ